VTLPLPQEKNKTWCFGGYLPGCLNPEPQTIIVQSTEMLTQLRSPHGKEILDNDPESKKRTDTKTH